MQLQRSGPDCATLLSSMFRLCTAGGQRKSATAPVAKVCTSSTVPLLRRSGSAVLNQWSPPMTAHNLYQFCGVCQGLERTSKLLTCPGSASREECANMTGSTRTRPRITVKQAQSGHGTRAYSVSISRNPWSCRWHLRCGARAGRAGPFRSRSSSPSMRSV